MTRVYVETYWRIKLSDDVYHSDNGTEHRAYATGFATREAAVARLRDIRVPGAKLVRVRCCVVSP